jgi:opacity protein-like surface antigen
MMRTRATLLTVAASVLLSASFGFAWADGAAPASAAAERYDWTGLYVGAQLGGLANLSEISDPLGPSMFGNPNLGTGPFAGGQIGYNYQSGTVVYGLEADVAFTETRGTSTCSSLSGTFINSNCKVGMDAFGTLAARLGLALGADGRSLIYGKAGAAWSSGSIDVATNDGMNGELGNPFTRAHSSVNRWGWTLGAGMEYALEGNWSVKGEYDFAGFGRQSVALPASAYVAPDGAVGPIVAARQGRFSDDLHLFKLGLNYRFGDGLSEVQTAAASSAFREDGPDQNLAGYGFEIGGRYWYSWGRHKYDYGHPLFEHVPRDHFDARLTYDDLEASSGEVAGRLTAPWNIFVKGFAGGGSISGGRMNDEDYNVPGTALIGPNPAQVAYTNALLPEVSGDIPVYGTADLGYDWWRTRRYRVGTYVGYNYYRESLGAYGCVQTANIYGACGPMGGGIVPTSGHSMITLDATWQSLRLGATTEFYLADRLKFSGDAAYLPYVALNGADRHYLGNTNVVASINPFSGDGIGTQLEAMLTYDVTDSISIGLGARYWAMWTREGTTRRVYDSSGQFAIPGPYFSQKNETERAGVLGQLMYKFDTP